LDELGELAELPLLPTMAQPARVELTPKVASEQTLLSLVMAHVPPDAATEETAGETSEGVVDLEKHQSLLAELQPMGAEATVLLGGALVVRVQPMGNAQDQAAQAARMALLVAERWPDARIAVVTGRGRLSQGLVTGEAIDRAWRLLTHTPSLEASTGATPRTRIFVDDVSAGLLDGRFELQRCSNEGFSLGAERVETDTERLLLGLPTPCVGRERELSMLESVLGECRDESVARAVLVLAPAGMGKSRLRHEFLRRVEGRGKPLLKLQGRGDPMKVKASYGLLGDALRGLCGVTPRLSLPEQQEALLTFVSSAVPASDARDTTEFLGELCGVPFSDADSPRLRAARQDPYIMSDQVERAWLHWLRAVATIQPILLVLEDLHWADALTVKLVQAALQYLSEYPLMVLALARPEVQHLYPNLWAGLPVQLPLNPLPKKASERLVRQILGSNEDPVEVGRIIDQAAGNPLFLEELIRAVAEHQGGSAPGTVMAILQARIGRLSPSARRTLRAASVYGQSFTEAGVRRLLSLTGHTELLRGELDELLREELIELPRERRGVAGPDFMFHHGLMRDAAYGLLSPEELVAWHASAGQYLESVGSQSPVQLAEHFLIGNDRMRAASYFLRAAEQASEAGDLETSLACIEQGLACGAEGKARGELLALRIAAWLYKERFAETLHDSPETLALLEQGSVAWCRVFTALFPAAVFLEGKQLQALMETFLTTNPHADARATYVHGTAMLSVMCGIMGQRAACLRARLRAKELCPQLDRNDHNALGVVHGSDANWFEQINKLPYTNLMENLRASAKLQAAGNRHALGAFGVYVGKAWFDLGKRERALRELRLNLQLSETLQAATPLTYSRTYLARVLATSADPQDLAEAEQCARLVLAGRNASMLGLAHGVLAQISFARQELSQADTEARAACAALQYFPTYRSDIMALHSQILRAQGQTQAALQICEAALEEYRSLDLEPYGLLSIYAELAECKHTLGDSAGAQSAVAAALPILEQRTVDITDLTLVGDYLHKVTENAQLLQRAQDWHLALPTLLAELATTASHRN